jgi:hypothetical protein
MKMFMKGYHNLGGTGSASGLPASLERKSHAKAQRRRSTGEAIVGQAVHNATYSVADEFCTEIDQQPQAFAGQTKVSQQLLFVYRRDCFQRLQLNDELVLDNQISAKALLKSEVFIMNADWHLPRHPQIPLSNFMRQDDLVDRFKKSWA